MGALRPERERCWLVITAEGGHTTVGPSSDPSEEDIASLEEQCRGLGVAAWLVAAEGRYYRPEDRMSLLRVRDLAGHGDWDAAAKRYSENAKRISVEAPTLRQKPGREVDAD